MLGALVLGIAAATALQCDSAACESDNSLGPLGRALSCSAFAAVTIPVVVFSRRTWLVLLALAVATAGAAYQLNVMQIRSDFWSHIVVGTMCCRLSWYALQSGYIRVPWKIGLLGAGGLTMEATVLFLKMDGSNVFNQMHQLLNLGQVALFISFAADDFLENSARACARINTPNLSRAR